jgi:hypothetical protein
MLASMEEAVELRLFFFVYWMSPAGASNAAGGGRSHS